MGRGADAREVGAAEISGQPYSEYVFDETRATYYDEHPAAVAAWVEHDEMQAVTAPDSAGVTPETVVDWATAKAGRTRAARMATRMMDDFRRWIEQAIRGPRLSKVSSTLASTYEECR